MLKYFNDVISMVVDGIKNYYIPPLDTDFISKANVSQLNEILAEVKDKGFHFIKGKVVCTGCVGDCAHTAEVKRLQKDYDYFSQKFFNKT